MKNKADSLKDQLTQIHRSIFRRFRYLSDLDKYSLSEHWEHYDEIPDHGIIEGDCDMFALSCRKECRKLKIPSRLVFCQTESDEYHLVLESGGWILDNRSSAVMDIKSFPYRWISISGYERTDPWHKIKI